jgi:hypothetical protein
MHILNNTWQTAKKSTKSVQISTAVKMPPEEVLTRGSALRYILNPMKGSSFQSIILDILHNHIDLIYISNTYLAHLTN